jgi:hypothetical protein
MEKTVMSNQESNILQIKGFHFDDPTIPDEKKMGMVAAFNRVVEAASEGAGSWLHDLAKEFNDPKHGPLAAQKFENKIEGLIQKVIQNQKELAGFLMTDADVKTLKLTGNGLVAAPFRKIFNAMKYGGDLRKLDTVSKCSKFATEQKKKLDDEATAKNLREACESKALAAGLERDTPEFEAFIDKEMNGGVSLVPNTGTALGPQDELTKAFAEMESIARETLKYREMEDVLALVVGYKQKMFNLLDNYLHPNAMRKAGALVDHSKEEALADAS